MWFYIIHNNQFPLRKVFLEAQFKRYDITNYEFIDIQCSGVILSTYINTLHLISLKKGSHDSSCCILIDTILITRNLLDRIEYSHFITVSSEKSNDINFIHPSPSDHSTRINKQTKTIHKDCWKWDDHINYSSCFVVTPSYAKLMCDYHNHYEKTNEYNNINEIFLYKNIRTGRMEHSLNSVDKWLLNCAIMYSNHSLHTLWLS